MILSALSVKPCHYFSCSSHWVVQGRLKSLWPSFSLQLTRNTQVVLNFQHKLPLVGREIKCAVTVNIDGLPVINNECLEAQYRRPRFSQE